MSIALHFGCTEPANRKQLALKPTERPEVGFGLPHQLCASQLDFGVIEQSIKGIFCIMTADKVVALSHLLH